MRRVVIAFLSVLLAAAWIASADASAERGAPDEGAVPLAIQSLSLSQAQSDATATSPDVAAARAREDAAFASYRLAAGALGPALFASVTTAPQAGPSPGQTIGSNLTTIGAQATLGDLLAYSPAAAQAHSAYLAARARTSQAIRVEQIRAAKLYFAALGAMAGAAAASDFVRSAQAQRDAAAKRLGTGDAPRLDFVRADIALARAQADFATADAVKKNAIAVLSIETGVDESALCCPVPGAAPALPADARDAARAVALALASRPEIAAAQDDVRAAATAVDQARLGILPLISVSAGYARGTDSGQHIAGPAVSAQLTLPLSFAPSARVSAAQAALAEARAALAIVQRQTTIDVASAVTTLEASRAAVRATTRARREADLELRAVELGYRSGASSSLDVESARSSYASARAAELTALYDQVAAEATLAVEVQG